MIRALSEAGATMAALHGSRRRAMARIQCIASCPQASPAPGTSPFDHKSLTLRWKSVLRMMPSVLANQTPEVRLSLIVDHILTIHLSPNCSLTPRAAALFFASICLVTFSIATGMACKGLWPIFRLPALEMLLLGWALRVSLRRRHYSQTITVSDEQVESTHAYANATSNRVPAALGAG